MRGSTHALRGVSVEVPRGRVTGLLGPSGSGKTTLIRAIVGVQIVQSGTVVVLGRPARVARAARTRRVRDAGAVGLPGPDGAREPPLLRADRRAGPQVVDEVLDTVGLAERADVVVRSLSGGERSRVSLASAMLGRPELLVLDEPTVGLDPVLRRDLWNTFHRLADAGATLLVSSHVMDEAERCDELIMIRDGSIVAQGEPDELRRRTGTDDLEQVFLTLVEDA